MKFNSLFKLYAMDIEQFKKTFISFVCCSILYSKISSEEYKITRERKSGNTGNGCGRNGRNSG